MNKTKRRYDPIPLQLSLVLRYLHQQKGETLRNLQNMYPQYARTTLYRHMKVPQAEVFKEKLAVTKGKRGRPRKITSRGMRKIITSVTKPRKTVGDFSSTDIQREAGLSERDVSNRTVRRYLNKAGYGFTQCRRKGQLLTEDLKKRLEFARRCKNLPSNFWAESISFYFDGVGWAHKTNPAQHARTSRTRTWKKRGESLDQHCTAKGKKEGVGGRMARFFVAIAHGRGIIKCHQYAGNVNGQTCANFVREHFPGMFQISANNVDRQFLQDNCPSQNSALARGEMEAIGCKVLYRQDHQTSIPLRTSSIW